MWTDILTGHTRICNDDNEKECLDPDDIVLVVGPSASGISKQVGVGVFIIYYFRTVREQ